MKAHELAKALLDCPNLPVLINGWGSDEGNTFEAKLGEIGVFSFNGKSDDINTPKDKFGFALPRSAIYLKEDKT